ncbi:MAG: hypothetical protein M3179_12890 [Actinomycetota bacterium]|nr:hypothetical protein [Actinomycetota bacterium]
MRKPAVFGFSAVAAVLLISSVAFACVQTRGRIQVTGSLGTRSSAIGNGFHPGPGNVEYCHAPRAGARVPQPTGFSPNQRPTITVSVAPATDCNPLPQGSFAPGQPNVLADGNYEVNFCDGTVFQTNANGKLKEISSNRSDENAHGSCFFSDSLTDRGLLIGQLAVTNSSGSGSYHIPFGAAVNGPTDYAGVAIRRCGTSPTVSGCASATPQTGGGPPHVNMAPISII